jgi:hypothetical protein
MCSTNINCCDREEVFVKEQEGVITDRGTIKVLSSSGVCDIDMISGV